jgi:hypothetical protein
VGDSESDLGTQLVFDPKLSSTFKPSDFMCTIMFGSGKLQGFFGRESVWMNYHPTEISSKMKKPSRSLAKTIHIPSQELGFAQKS